MLLLDAGAFLAVERGNRDVLALLKQERVRGRAPVTSGGVVAQVWRGGGRQAAIARVFVGMRITAVDERLGRAAGALMARARTSDAIDATLVCLASDGDEILTSDPNDLRELAWAAGIDVELIAV